MLLFHILCIATLLTYIENYVRNDEMTASELEFYFESMNRDSEIPSYEIVYLPTSLKIREAFAGQNEADFKFTAFGSPISLKLKPNKHLTSPTFKTYIQDEYGTNEVSQSSENCHYLHRDGTNVAAISICQPNSVQGFLFLDNVTLEIHPLTPHLQSAFKLREPLSSNSEEEIPHVVRRAMFLPRNSSHLQDMWFANPNTIKRNFNLNLDEMDTNLFHLNDVEAASHKPVDALTAELALFFDAEGYKIFAPYFGYDDTKLRDMLLAYMNGIQALYHHPSLGTSLQLVLVRMDIMKTQPSKMPHYDGERSKLLDSFCAYQKSLNPRSDENPGHWDMALYVSGLDFFAYENGRKDGATMGLATVGGVCLPQYACVIAEMGTTNMFGKPYPSAGFTSVYILAHEIGHNLGMHHDGVGNNCPKEGYIMSPSRGVQGETQWSTCSADVMTKLSRAECLMDSGEFPPPPLDHSRFMDTPGQIFTAKKQCQILLRDKDAVASPNQQLSTICYSLQCKTPRRSGYYFAGPALEGTECGKGKYCFGGECVSKIIPTPAPVIPGGWGPWIPETCTSACLDKSLGYQIRRRTCDNPTPVNTDRGCEGSTYGVVLCKDDKICRKTKRASAVEHASLKCKEFSKLLPQLDSNGAGLQAPHEEARVWMGCAIFCRRKDSGSYYTPRVELNDMGVSPYFPDGTWCHTDQTGQNYYCLQHHCLPEGFQLSKLPKKLLNGIGEDIPISQNAHPSGEVPPNLLSYLSLDSEGRPIQTILKPDHIKPSQDEWETKDYLELPNDKENYV